MTSYSRVNVYDRGYVSSPHLLWDVGVHLWLKVGRHSWPVDTFLKSGVKRSKGAGTTPLMR